MNTVILYASAHHGNTKKLVSAIADEYGAELLDVAGRSQTDLSGYDCIGIASGISFGKYYPQMLKFLESNLPDSKKVFFMHTAGNPKEKYNEAAKKITDSRGCECLGTYFCKGYDTYGPFKIIGGIAKGHPDEKDIMKAKEFFRTQVIKAEE